MGTDSPINSKRKADDITPNEVSRRIVINMFLADYSRKVSQIVKESKAKRAKHTANNQSLFPTKTNETLTAGDDPSDLFTTFTPFTPLTPSSSS